MTATTDQQTIISSYGVRVPALGFGTFTLEGAVCRDMVKAALSIGYRHVDTAKRYGNEEAVGAGIRESEVPRDQVFLTSKVWMDQLHYDDLTAAADDSLTKLQTDYLDLLLIHWPNARVPLSESLRALADLQRAGKVRYVGVSNFTVGLMQEAVEQNGADIVCNQVEYHPFLNQQPVLQEARRLGLFLTAYCPLAQGRVPNDPTLQAIGEKHGKTAAQVALRWLVEQGDVAAIPKSSSVEHARANFEIFDFALDREDQARIAQLMGGTRVIDPSWAPQWDPA
ncbi:aldo/keto reductase [Rhodovibrio salinarum]|uniref:Aldo/keto reductase n=1 Tax=Rhodovibrio salinarum TaxID=1087 RepID=A0A934QM85_9PROT|nr:aldo/keto reductase [Rhodovibrio salinarum]MBK1699050.1 aldo/keto reductase [Rhodovibrio salinarum]